MHSGVFSVLNTAGNFNAFLLCVWNATEVLVPVRYRMSGLTTKICSLVINSEYKLCHSVSWLSKLGEAIKYHKTLSLYLITSQSPVQEVIVTHSS